MITRTRNTLAVCSHPFELKGVDRVLPPGEYKVITDELLIEELSFPVYRRVSTMILVPEQFHASTLKMVTIDPHDLQAALDRDKVMPPRLPAAPQ
jgi:hypothetical protein